LRKAGVDAVFIPKGTEELYPLLDGFQIKAPEKFSSSMEGKFRPTHFDGVANVVLRLFLLAQPHRAFFGEKDYQQLKLIQSLVKDFGLSIEIKGHPTLREKSGLALSSRNRYFNATQKEEAAKLYQILLGSQDLMEAKQKLQAQGFQVEYLESWDNDLMEPKKTFPSRWLVAARFHQVRLIDNILKKNDLPRVSFH
jgi:pantoate--beta-alanine ligase